MPEADTHRGNAAWSSRPRVLRLRPPASHFAALGRAVVCQRRVGAAAAVIDGRLIAALGGELAPRRLLSLPAGGSVLPTCPSI